MLTTTEIVPAPRVVGSGVKARLVSSMVRPGPGVRLSRVNAYPPSAAVARRIAALAVARPVRCACAAAGATWLTAPVPWLTDQLALRRSASCCEVFSGRFMAAAESRTVASDSRLYMTGLPLCA